MGEVYNMAHQASHRAGLAAAVRAIKEGKLVAFPTETVYGLGANALNEAAVRSIFAAKGRPADNPLIVHVPSVSAIHSLVASAPPMLEKLAVRFWPGPLTLIMPKSELIPDIVTAKLDTVAIRVPNHPVALALLNATGLPIAAPSANRSGRPSPTQATHVQADMGKAVAVLLDGGPTGVGLESTVLDLTTKVPTVLRPGGVTVEQLQDVLGQVEIDPRANGIPSMVDENSRVRSPGMKYTHYAPRAPVTLVEGHDTAAIWAAILKLAQEHSNKGPVGLLVSDEGKDWLSCQFVDVDCQLVVQSLGSRYQPEVIARAIYASLRNMDDTSVKHIIIEGIPADGIGLAIMNRLRRAAGGHIHLVGEV